MPISLRETSTAFFGRAGCPATHNSVGYREQIRSAMSGVPVAGVVPDALPLADRLVEAPYGKIARAEEAEQ